MAFEKEKQAAIEAVRRACQLCAEVQRTLVTADTMEKKDKSPVTIADFGSQAVVNKALRTVFPEDALVGEEDAAYLRDPANAPLKSKLMELIGRFESGLPEDEVLNAIDYGARACDFSGRYWTLDPIDGTKGFLRGEQYAIALALVENGELKVGVLGCPNLPHDAKNPASGQGCIFYAVKGEGAFVRSLDSEAPRRIGVDGIHDAAAAVFCESVEKAHAAHDDHARLASLLGVKAAPYRIDSQCKYAAVARGDASIYLRLPSKKGYQEKIWDHAAGVMVVTEAGGRVTDVRGKPLNFTVGRELKENLGVIVTNGHLHAVVLEAADQVLA